MGLIEISQIVICVFAVIGLYLLCCRIVSHFTDSGSVSICVRASDCEDIGELDCAVKSAALLGDGMSIISRPVLIFDTPQEIESLDGTAYGLEIYIKYVK